VCFYDYYRETAFHILLSLSIKQLQNLIFDIQVCIKQSPSQIYVRRICIF